MNTIKKISIIALLGAAVFSTGCKKFLDVNTNPNVVYGPQVSLVLPSAQMYVASAVGCNLQINGSIWAQHWTQSPLASQYKILEQYFPSGSNYQLYNSASAVDVITMISFDGVTLKAVGANNFIPLT
jgi:hypothetical protein